MAAIPSQVLVWKFGIPSGNLMSQPKYEHQHGVSLQCTANNKFLTWGKQPIGINLVWVPNGTDQKIHFTTQDKKAREIVTGEPLALGIGGGEAFLYYKKRSLGINLSWALRPDYEWRIYGASGKKGEKIRAGEAYGLVNVEVQPHKDFLMPFDRPPGMCDIGWTTSPTTFGDLFKVATTVAKIAPLL